jgi:hypothetical protein
MTTSNVFEGEEADSRGAIATPAIVTATMLNQKIYFIAAIEETPRVDVDLKTG